MNKIFAFLFNILKWLFEFFFVIKDDPIPIKVTEQSEEIPVLYSARPYVESQPNIESFPENPQPLGFIETKPQLPPMPKLNIIKKFLEPSQYVNGVTNKTGIVLHHTVGGTLDSTWNFWQNQKERVATHFIIDRDGTIVQCFPLENWAFHIYIGSPGNNIAREHKQKSSLYDRSLIGIELCSYGPLSLRNDNYITVYNKQIPKDKVETLQYRGFNYWEKYTDKQIEALELLLIDLINKHPKIKSSLKTDYSDIFNISEKALNLEPGIWSHTSLRTDKSDCYPDKSLVNMLNNLKQKVN